MKDYYAILGLDAEASSDSIKVAYRRLAHQYHPDRLVGASADEIAVSSERMREINEAYAFLSKRPRNGQYNPRPSGNGQAAVEVPDVVRRAAEGVRPDSSVVFSTLSAELSGKVRRALAKSEMKWSAETLEGFEWAMVSSSLLTRYAVLFRGFVSMDMDVTRKLANYAELAIERSSSYRRNYFLFLIACHRIPRADEVATACRQFCYSKRGGKVAEIEIALVDAGHAKSVLCGPKVRDEKYTRLLYQLGFGGR